MSCAFCGHQVDWKLGCTWREPPGGQRFGDPQYLVWHAQAGEKNGRQCYRFDPIIGKSWDEIVEAIRARDPARVLKSLPW